MAGFQTSQATEALLVRSARTELHDPEEIGNRRGFCRSRYRHRQLESPMVSPKNWAYESVVGKLGAAFRQRAFARLSMQFVPLASCCCKRDKRIFTGSVRAGCKISLNLRKS